ncbi:hypothetical protein Q8A73_023668 [Channa argus]|nr:hypothetical protein Q8A73_023668 [Channa argus]
MLVGTEQESRKVGLMIENQTSTLKGSRLMAWAGLGSQHSPMLSPLSFLICDSLRRRCQGNLEPWQLSLSPSSQMSESVKVSDCRNRRPVRDNYPGVIWKPLSSAQSEEEEEETWVGVVGWGGVRDVEVKRGRGFLPSLCRGEVYMAAGLGPDCRRISSVAERGIAECSKNLHRSSLTTQYGKPLTPRSGNKARSSAQATTGCKSYQLPSSTSRDSEEQRFASTPLYKTCIAPRGLQWES